MTSRAPVSHARWASILAGQPTQKDFSIAPAGGDVQEISITLFEDQPTAPGDTSAEQTGWGVSVAYKAAPDEMLFRQTSPAESQARGMFDDLCRASAEVTGLIRKQDMEKAQAATAELLKKFGANTGSTPIQESGQV